MKFVKGKTFVVAKLLIVKHTYTHTHTHIYIYIYNTLTFACNLKYVFPAINDNKCGLWIDGEYLENMSYLVLYVD
jgi:hypothetical protein